LQVIALWRLRAVQNRTVTRQKTAYAIIVTEQMTENGTTGHPLGVEQNILHSESMRLKSKFRSLAIPDYRCEK
jgi:hypothetical protein